MGVLDNISPLKEILIGVNNAEAVGMLMELQQQAYAILDENRELRLKLEEIERLDEISHQLTFKNDAYFLQNDKEPYCVKCWDSSRQLVHLTNSSRAMTRHGNKVCSNCKSYFKVAPS
ncbi:hypothetical protein HAX40_13030 [Enterococcus casseliflavus]|uniref:hypothetical protein n=1 Tax=Enterococcus casseliflavus TaxID=37734 RepID=UPI00115C53C8|nr:hypothetical protein [Enterococcus casseliflavus]MBF0011889.1 hypothetical protein [Enterococcus casseliflavus]